MVMFVFGIAQTTFIRLLNHICRIQWHFSQHPVTLLYTLFTEDSRISRIWFISFLLLNKQYVISWENIMYCIHCMDICIFEDSLDSRESDLAQSLQ